MNPGIPLSLYVHTPWCVEKCPYCDFNSHELKTELPESQYIEQLYRNLESQLPWFWGRRIETIFIGGGTPSLFSGSAIDSLLSGLRARLMITADPEITMESNPGTADANNYAAYREAGVNRLSIGIQSLDNGHLNKLGRIHSSDEAIKAIQMAKQAGFKRINGDLMFGLGKQTIDQAMDDLKRLIDQDVEHISWYQLTIEPNTAFYSSPPENIPSDDYLGEMQAAGAELLTTAGYNQYEVSAWSKAGGECKHNINYWEFGDYVGIGAGAHGKITDFQESNIYRIRNRKQPHHWLDNSSELISERTPIKSSDLPLEFFMNTLRLNHGVPKSYFFDRTGLLPEQIMSILNTAVERELLDNNSERFIASVQGRNYLNDLLALFLPDGSLPESNGISDNLIMKSPA